MAGNVFYDQKQGQLVGLALAGHMRPFAADIVNLQLDWSRKCNAVNGVPWPKGSAPTSSFGAAGARTVVVLPLAPPPPTVCHSPSMLPAQPCNATCPFPCYVPMSRKQNCSRTLQGQLSGCGSCYQPYVTCGAAPCLMQCSTFKSAMPLLPFVPSGGYFSSFTGGGGIVWHSGLVHSPPRPPVKPCHCGGKGENHAVIFVKRALFVCLVQSIFQLSAQSTMSAQAGGRLQFSRALT
jgi:hypothetical protein